MRAITPRSWSDVDDEEIRSPCCPACEAPLVLHQPDAGLPHRLLAVCEACKCWYVSDAQALLLTPIAVSGWRRPRHLGPPSRGGEGSLN